MIKKRQWWRRHCWRRNYWQLKSLKQVMRCTNVLRILQQVSRLLKVLMMFKNVLIILQQMRRLTKVLKNWKIRKMQWSQSIGRIQIILRVGLKDPQDGLILIISFQRENFLHLNQTSIKTLWKGYWRSRHGTV